MAALSMLQGILVVRLVGIDGLGVVTTVTVFVSNIHRLLSFRMSEVVVRFLGAALARGDQRQGAAVVRWAVGWECSTSLAAMVILAGLAPWGAQVLLKNPGSVGLIWLYGLVLLGNLVYETSTGILQSLRRFDRLAQINIIQSLLTFCLVVFAFGFHKGVPVLVTAYLAGKLFAGLAVAWLAARSMVKSFGAGWWRLAIEEAGFGRRLFSFAVNTNLQSTVNLLVRDNVPLLLGGLRSQIEVGYFKLALSIINLIMLPIDPLIGPTYTEISQTIANRMWTQTRQLLRRVSLVAAAWTITAGAGVALLAPWLIPLMYGFEATPAYPAVMILLVGYGFANILNWNRPLLLALGRPVIPLVTSAILGLAALGFTFWLVPKFGYTVQAGILSAYFVGTITITVWRGLAELHKQAILDREGQADGGLT